MFPSKVGLDFQNQNNTLSFKMHGRPIEKKKRTLKTKNPVQLLSAGHAYRAAHVARYAPHAAQSRPLSGK